MKRTRRKYTHVLSQRALILPPLSVLQESKAEEVVCTLQTTVDGVITESRLVSVKLLEVVGDVIVLTYYDASAILKFKTVTIPLKGVR